MEPNVTGRLRRAIIKAGIARAPQAAIIKPRLVVIIRARQAATTKAVIARHLPVPVDTTKELQVDTIRARPVRFRAGDSRLLRSKDTEAITNNNRVDSTQVNPVVISRVVTSNPEVMGSRKQADIARQLPVDGRQLLLASNSNVLVRLVRMRFKVEPVDGRRPVLKAWVSRQVELKVSRPGTWVEIRLEEDSRE
jgi:hypothetical protein